MYHKHYPLQKHITQTHHLLHHKQLPTPNPKRKNQQYCILFCVFFKNKSKCSPYTHRRTALEKKLEELRVSEDVRNQKRAELARKETEYIHERRVRLTGHSFDSIRVIGRGAFGEVYFLPPPTPFFSTLTLPSTSPFSHLSLFFLPLWPIPASPIPF